MENLFEYNIIIIFIFFVFIFILIISIYYLILNPKKKMVNKIIEKFKKEDYMLTPYVAERYVVWNNMRSFFYFLHYMLTLLSVYAGLMTVYYASSANDKSNCIIFLALLSMCFTITGIFSNPLRTATMSQHVWRELDSCIIAIISNKHWSKEEKDMILAYKIVQLEKYIETYER